MAFNNVGDIFTRMPEVFNPNEAKDMDKVFQFDISGEGGGQWYVKIKDGQCQVQEGFQEDPSVTLTMSAETWIAMVNKELNGVQAFMTGKLKVSGDILLAQRIYDLFSI